MDFGVKECMEMIMTSLMERVASLLSWPLLDVRIGIGSGNDMPRECEDM